MGWLTDLLSKKRSAGAEGLTLSDAAVGHRVKILHVGGEQAEAHRLREMGFRESAVIDKTADSGALICKVGEARVALSKKLGQTILVEDLGKSVLKISEETILLSQMTIGQRGVIRDYTADNNDYERIVEMGVTPGEQVEIIRYAPLGDPIEIRIRGYLLSLRKQEADRIKVALLI
jgi:ferrous iron transport protein A